MTKRHLYSSLAVGRPDLWLSFRHCRPDAQRQAASLTISSAKAASLKWPSPISGVAAKPAAFMSTFNGTLFADLQGSGLFDMVSKSMLPR